MQGLDIFSLAWILSFVAVLLAAFVRGVSGFGFALILAPILLLILNSKSVVIINLFLGFLANIVVFFYCVRKISLRKITPMMIACLIGVPLGAYIIYIIDAAMLKIIVGGVILVFAIPMAFGFNLTLKNETAASGAAGFLSGVLITATSLGGPPVVLYMHNQRWEKEDIYNNQAGYFLFANVCAFIALSLSGFMDAQIAIFSVSLMPALLIGTVLGIVAFRRINQRFFRYLSLAIVIGTGILGIISGLGLFGR
jgi:uncharacterized membrane protein YfcA